MNPFYHVILHDDDRNTHRYVVYMLRDIFGYDESKGFALACEVNESGRAIVATVRQEVAEQRVKQIREYQPTPPMPHSPGSMRASMEPAS